MNETLLSFFFKLIQLGIGTRESLHLETPLPESTWKELLTLTRKQAVTGIVMDGILKLPAEYLPPPSHQAERDTAAAADRTAEPAAERGSRAGKRVPASGRLCLHDTERTGHCPILPQPAAPDAGRHRRMAGRGTECAPEIWTKEILR